MGHNVASIQWRLLQKILNYTKDLSNVLYQHLIAQPYYTVVLLDTVHVSYSHHVVSADKWNSGICRSSTTLRDIEKNLPSRKYMYVYAVKACNNALGGNIRKHPKLGAIVSLGVMWDPGVGRMNDFCHGYQHSMFYTKKNPHAHACMPYKMYGHVSIHSHPGCSRGCGRLHGSNVLTCCLPGRVHEGWVLFRMGVIMGFYGRELSVLTCIENLFVKLVTCVTM